MTEAIERVVTHGTFSLDGGTWEVDNNVWIIGDNKHVTIIDPAHDVDKIATKVAGRTVEKILLTHAHDDHIRSAKEAAERFKAPVYLNPEDRVLWEMVYPSWDFDEPLHDGQKISVGATELQVLATPGHSPGSVCFYAPELSWENSEGVLHRVEAAHPARIHCGSHRSRRLHRHRRGGARPRRLEETRALKQRWQRKKL